MACSGCEERRKAIKEAWMRIKKMSLMSNGNGHTAPMTAEERERLATEGRTAQHEALMRRQKEIAAMAITSRNT